MLQDKDSKVDQYKLFLDKVAEHKMVWGLQSEEGWANSPSNDYEETDVIPFWSDKAYATAVAKEDWSLYEPAPIEITDFLENWLVGMHNDELMVGINWDADLFGKEIEPLELALEIIDHLISNKVEVSLTQFESLTAFKNSIKNKLK